VILRLNGPMVERLRKCAADTDPNWAGRITIYPPEARELVELIDRFESGEPLLTEIKGERYGKCLTCGRLARWWDDELAARWVHIHPWAVTGPAAHRAEVADA
jgi:hypothetical protein